MLGPLPLLHRAVIVVGSLVVWIGLGLWSGLMPDVPISLGTGACLGVVAGLVTAYVLLHDFHRDPPLSTGGGPRSAL